MERESRFPTGQTRPPVAPLIVGSPEVQIAQRDADLYAPPALMRAFARTIPRAELAVIGEGGHALFWEQPEGFNRTILSFLERHREGMSI